MPDPGARAGLSIPVNPLIWFRESGSGGHVVLKAMGEGIEPMAVSKKKAQNSALEPPKHTPSPLSAPWCL